MLYTHLKRLVRAGLVKSVLELLEDGHRVIFVPNNSIYPIATILIASSVQQRVPLVQRFKRCCFIDINKGVITAADDGWDVIAVRFIFGIVDDAYCTMSNQVGEIFTVLFIENEELVEWACLMQNIFP